MSAAWSEHTAPNGKLYYYNRTSGESTWTKPADFSLAKPLLPTLEHCLNDSPQVAALFNAILRTCGPEAVPTISLRYGGEEDPLCKGGRGGAFCCHSNRIYLCTHPWVSCREMAYELSHALNNCRGLISCRKDGMQLDGQDCGYFSPPDVACSELRASYFTGRCKDKKQASGDAGGGGGGGDDGSLALGRDQELQRCMAWHARWATVACFPEDENLEAHVRWAKHRCWPEGADVDLGRPPAPDRLVDQFVSRVVPVETHRWKTSLTSKTVMALSRPA